MNDNTKSVRLVHNFSSFEELGYLVQGWGLDYKVIDCGPFIGQHNQLISPHILIGEARYNRHLRQAGSTPPGMRTFVIITQDTTPFTWRKEKVTRNCIVVFPKGAELEATSFPGFHVYTLSISESLLEKQLQQEIEHQPSLRDKFQKGGIYKVNYSTLQKLRTILGQALYKTKEIPDILQSAIFHQSLIDKATNLIFEAVSQGGQGQQSLSFSKHAKIVQAVDEWIASTDYRQHSVKDMTRDLNINERTLRRVISGWYGVPPKQYLLSLQLLEVRKEIILSLGTRLSINDIARRMGFTHMGNFAALYRRQFNELPSDTLYRHT